ncbi:MAG: hypothetical protein JWO28_1398, partial [Hyphomicrobiales bacterium]|nr:hypothetical protein [Hyphomicrobiales bacterium]
MVQPGCEAMWFAGAAGLGPS